MTDIEASSHHDMMKLKHKKKTLHRRTQSNTAYDMNNMLGIPQHNQETADRMARSHNIMSANDTEKAIEASRINSQIRTLL